MSLLKKLEVFFALKGNIRVMSIIAFLRGIGNNMLRVVWQPFALSLGASMKTLGGLESAMDLTRSSVQPISGKASDKVGRKLFITLRSALSLIAFIFYTVAGLAGAWYALVPGVIFMALTGISQPAWSSAVAESTNPEERGTAYSAVIFFFMITGLFAPIVGGILALNYGFVSVFYICMAMEASGLTLTMLFLKEPLRRSVSGAVLTMKDVKQTLKNILRPERHLIGFYAAITIDVFAWSIGSRLFYGMLTKTYGFTSYQLGLMATLSSASMALSQVPIGRFVDKFGRKIFLAISEVAGIIVLAGRLFSTSFEMFMVFQIPMGICASTWVPAMQAWLADNVKDENRAEAMGRLSAFRGILSFPAPYIGGFLYDMSGFAAPILANLIGASLALAVILLYVHDADPDRM